MVIAYSKSKDQPGKVANPAQWPAEQGKLVFPCPRSRLRILSREMATADPSRVSLLISILRLNLVLTFTGFLPIFAAESIYLDKPPYVIGLVSSSSGRAMRIDGVHWRVRRHRASKPQGSSKPPVRMHPWHVTIGPINTRLSYSHPLLLV